MKQHIRSNSIDSAASSSTTASLTPWTRAGEMFDRLLNQQTNTDVHLWSTGNVRIDAHDLTLGAGDVIELLGVLRDCHHFKFVDFVHLGDGEEWKASYRVVDGSLLSAPTS